MPAAAPHTGRRSRAASAATNRLGRFRVGWVNHLSWQCWGRRGGSGRAAQAECCRLQPLRAAVAAVARTPPPLPGGGSGATWHVTYLWRYTGETAWSQGSLKEARPHGAAHAVAAERTETCIEKRSAAETALCQPIPGGLLGPAPATAARFCGPKALAFLCRFIADILGRR